MESHCAHHSMKGSENPRSKDICVAAFPKRSRASIPRPRVNSLGRGSAHRPRALLPPLAALTRHGARPAPGHRGLTTCLTGVCVVGARAQVTGTRTGSARPGCGRSTLKLCAQNLFSEETFGRSTPLFVDRGSRPWCRVVPGPAPPDTTSLMNETLAKKSIPLSGQRDISGWMP